MQLGSQLVPDRPLDVGDEGELAVVLPLLTLDVVEGDVDDGNHHVDQDHVDGDGESEEDPGGQQVGILDVAKVELADAHGDGVLRRADDVPERRVGEYLRYSIERYRRYSLFVSLKCILDPFSGIFLLKICI